MARIRMIKPDFFIDDKVGELTVTARLLFVGLWCLADREGQLEDNPKKIKVQLLPYDDVDCKTLLDEIEKKEMIVRYSINEKKYIQIKNFTKHQRPHHTEKPSELPAFNGYLTVKQPLLDGDKKDNTDDGLRITDSIDQQVDLDFNCFWLNYPRKVGKAKCIALWRKLKPPLVKALQTLEVYKASTQWCDPQFIPHPATWLGQGRWDDEPLQNKTIEADPRCI